MSGTLAFCETDAAGRISFVSPSFETLLGRDGAGLPGLAVEELVAADSRADLRQALGKLASGAQEAELDLSYLCRDGATLRARSQLVARRGDSASPGVLIALLAPVDGQAQREVHLELAQEAGSVGFFDYDFDKDRNEAMVREREAELKTVVDLTPFMITRCSRDLTYRCVSKAYAAMLGRSPEEFVDRPIAEVIGERAFEAILPHIEQALAGRVVQFERTVRYGGVERDLSVVYTPERDASAEVIGWVASIADVTESRRTERALLVAEDRFRTFMDMSPARAWMKDEDGRFVFANRSLLEAFGLTPGDLLGRTDTELFPSEQAEEYRRNDTAVLRSGRPLEVSETAHERDGWHHVLSIKFPFRDAAGRAYVGGVALDITRQKLAEDALRASEERMQLAMQIASAATWDMDLVTGRLHWSDSHFRLLGHAPAPTREATVRMWQDAVHPDDLARLEEEWHRARDERDLFRVECRVRHASGSYIWASAAGRFFYDDASRPVRFVGVFFDVTERRRAEEALREADRRKDEFLAILAHELRNPLAPLRTALEALRTAPDKASAVDLLRPMMERQIAQLVRLIDDLLDISRITSGRFSLQKQPRALAELVVGAVEANRSAVGEAGLRLEVELPEDPCVIDVDPVRFTQVLSNLLHNAVKFTDPGGTVGVRASLDATRTPPTVELTVHDTGIGMSAATLPGVFDLFAQGDSRGRSTTGLGVGLALARQIVELHGGTIEAHSDGPGRGSRFTVRMPSREVRPDRSAARSEETVRIAKRVLVIDDNADAALSLAYLVTTLGGQAATAGSAEAGIRCAAEFRPDVVLLDIGLPDMDGYEACRQLRAQPFGASLCVVAVTGWGQESDRARAAAAGFDAHLTKPADPRALVALIAGRTGASA